MFVSSVPGFTGSGSVGIRFGSKFPEADPPLIIWSAKFVIAFPIISVNPLGPFMSIATSLLFTSMMLSLISVSPSPRLLIAGPLSVIITLPVIVVPVPYCRFIPPVCGL